MNSTSNDSLNGHEKKVEQPTKTNFKDKLKKLNTHKGSTKQEDLKLTKSNSIVIDFNTNSSIKDSSDLKCESNLINDKSPLKNHPLDHLKKLELKELIVNENKSETIAIEKIELRDNKIEKNGHSIMETQGLRGLADKILESNNGSSTIINQDVSNLSNNNQNDLHTLSANNSNKKQISIQEIPDSRDSIGELDHQNNGDTKNDDKKQSKFELVRKKLKIETNFQEKLKKLSSYHEEAERIKKEEEKKQAEIEHKRMEDELKQQELERLQREQEDLRKKAEEDLAHHENSKKNWSKTHQLIRNVLNRNKITDKSEVKIENVMKIENVIKLHKKIKSQEGLIETLRREASTTARSSENEIIYENNMSEIQSKNILAEQSLLNLKRQYQTLMVENKNLQFELEKSQMNLSISSQEMNSSNSKPEQEKLAEKALQMLKDKEKLNKEFKEKLEETIEINRAEVNKLLLEIHDYKERIKELESEAEEKNLEKSKAEEELKIEKSKFNNLNETFQSEKEKWTLEKEKLTKNTLLIETFYKPSINELEDQIKKLNLQKMQNDYEASAKQKDLISKDYRSRNSVNIEIDYFKLTIKNLEEQNSKNMNDYNQKIENLKKEKAELFANNLQLKDSLSNIETESILNSKKFQESRDNMSTIYLEVNSKNKELASLQERYEKELHTKNVLKNENQELKRGNEKMKLEIKEITERMKIVNENHTLDIMKSNEKYLLLENKYNQLNEMNEKVSGIHNTHDINKADTNIQINEKEKELDTFNKITQLQNEINSYKIEKEKLNIQLKEFLSIQSQNELLKKETEILKESTKSLQEMYEIQIRELQMQSLETNAEFQSYRKRTASRSIRNRENDKTKEIELQNEYGLKEKAFQLEVKNLKDDIESLTSENKKLHIQNETEVKQYYSRITTLEDQYIAFIISWANLSYEKDLENVVLQHIIKRYKEKKEEARLKKTEKK